MKKLLIVDDEFEMRQLLKLYLQADYLIEEAADGMEAINKVKKTDFDLMILDVMMPLMDGWETLRHVREFSDIPIIMLTAKGTVQDKVSGLSKGADDYLVKPFDEAELLARIHALLRRAQPLETDEEIMKYMGLIINSTGRSVMFNDHPLNLTQTEFDLLEVLVRNRGRVLSREQLVEVIWGVDFMGEERTIDSHIRNLRDKLKKAGVDPSLVKTVWGIGYKVE